jgi:hypothetical protein
MPRASLALTALCLVALSCSRPADPMKVLSLKLQEDIFEEVERVVHTIRIPRNTYINQALDFYTRLSRRKLLKQQLQKESRAVRMNSLRVLKEFERLEDELPE